MSGRRDGPSRRRTCQGLGGIQPNGQTGGGPLSGYFSVQAGHFFPLANTKDIVEANGARIPFTAASVPTAANPQVVCSVNAGVPIRVTWNFLSTSAFGYFTVQFPDRTTWTTTQVEDFVTAPNSSTSGSYGV